MWVDSLGWYREAAKMAMALGEHEVPFELQKQEEVLDVLEGLDEVEVGPDLYMTHYDDLKEQRADALPSIRWDPIPRITLITPDQAARVSGS